jgi:hypothetical protein
LTSVATQSEAEGQDTADKPLPLLLGRTLEIVQAPGPLAGSVVVSTFPTLSTPTHNEAEGQDIPVTALPL